MLVDSDLREKLRFVGLIEDIRAAAGMPVDVFTPPHIEQGSQHRPRNPRHGSTIPEK